MRTGAILVGCAMLVFSSRAAAQQAASAPPAPLPAPVIAQPAYRSSDMRVAGIVLTSLGAAMLAGGSAALGVGLAQASTGNSDGLAGLPGVLIGSSLMGTSAVLAAIGVPLWVVGSKPPKPGAAAAIPSWAVPTVGAGPRSVTLRWSF